MENTKKMPSLIGKLPLSNLSQGTAPNLLYRPCLKGGTIRGIAGFTYYLRYSALNSQSYLSKGGNQLPSLSLKVSPTRGYTNKSIRTFATKGRPNDLISDSITQIKNGYSRRFDKVYLSYSKEILQLLEALLQGGYIQNYVLTTHPIYKKDAVTPKYNNMKGSSIAQATPTKPTNISRIVPIPVPCGDNTGRNSEMVGGVEVSLKYYQSLPAIKGIQRLSKPNKRLYFSKKKIIQVSQEQS
jgi:ribosomal protein S8